MSKLYQTANRVTRLNDLPGRSLRVASRDRPNMMHDGLTPAPRLDGTDAGSQPYAMRRRDRQDTMSWSSPILSFLIDGFGWYGASYHAYPHATAGSPVEPSETRVRAPEPAEISWRERRRAMAIVGSAMHSGVAEIEDDINRAGPASETASGDILFDTDRPSRRGWLTGPWRAIAGRWARWRRKREIKKAIAALVEPVRRASRNFGIPNRSAIEQVTRCRHDC
jgi:hypothetical protein